jgi:hypothetical protein
VGIRIQILKFNIDACDIHQFPQTAGDGIHSLLEEVLWNIRDNFPNPCFQCARFCMVHLILCPGPQKKLQGVRSELLAGHSWGPRRPSQCPKNFLSKHARTEFAKWGDVPSCMKIRSSMFSQRSEFMVSRHCLHYRRVKDKMLFNDVHVHTIFIMIPLIQNIL